MNIPIPTKIGSRMGGAHTPKWDTIGFDPQPDISLGESCMHQSSLLGVHGNPSEAYLLQAPQPKSIEECRELPGWSQLPSQRSFFVRGCFGCAPCAVCPKWFLWACKQAPCFRILHPCARWWLFPAPLSPLRVSIRKYYGSLL